MARDRAKISSEVMADVLTKSRRRCCLCFGLHQDASEKKGQVAHLDQDRSNNALDNLAFLCFAHHDEYDSQSSQSKGLTVLEVKRYREMLSSVWIGAHQATGPEAPRVMTNVAPPAIELADNFGMPFEASDKVVAYISSGGTCRCAMANVLTRKFTRSCAGTPAIRSISLALVYPTLPRMSPHAVEVLREYAGVMEAGAHVTIAADVRYLNRASLLLAMDEKMLDQLLGQLPAAARQRARLFTEFFGGEGSIDDPYGQGRPAYERCYQKVRPLIESGIERLSTWMATH